MSSWQLPIPVVLLIFKRPHTTARVLAEIARVRPPKLLVVADGPRPDRPGEAEQCAAARAVIERVDWPCEVLTNYAAHNMGCADRVASGIDWAFTQVESAIILEDDCVPHPTFFRYCAELLDYYRDDTRIMAVSGDNFQQGQPRTAYSYYFSRYAHCWGWATWRRAWQHYDHGMRLWPLMRHNRWLYRMLQDETVARYWERIFQRVYAGQIDSWAYRWQLACWLQRGLTTLPEMNLVSNIGFDESSTHTKKGSAGAALALRSMQFPLRHPPFVVRHHQADVFTERHHFFIRSTSAGQRAYRQVRHIIRKIARAPRRILPTIHRNETQHPRPWQARELARALKRRISGQRVSPERALYERLVAELRSTPRYTERHVQVYGWHLTLPDTASFLSAFQEIFERQSYAFPTDKSAPCIVDLGANIGLSVLFFKRLYPRARIIAFEADPHIFRYLEQNVHGNGYTDVLLQNKAAWNSTTTLSFRPEGADAGRVVTEAGEGVIAVAAVDIADLLRAYPVDFLKIDIEGAEEHVLPAAREFLPAIPCVFVEYHSSPDKAQTLHQLLNLLHECGFRVQIHSARTCARPFMQSTTYAGFDMQLNIFAYRAA